jgi:hypothetical protein
MWPLPVEERDDIKPVCPHCDKQLGKLMARKLQASFLSRRLVYCCPYCYKVLGVSHRKGFLAS